MIGNPIVLHWIFVGEFKAFHVPEEVREYEIRIPENIFSWIFKSRAFNVEQIPGFSQIAKFLNPAGFLL